LSTRLIETGRPGKIEAEIRGNVAKKQRGRREAGPKWFATSMQKFGAYPGQNR